MTLDPEFAQAWAMLVEIHGQALWMGYDISEARRDAAMTALENARRFGPGQPETLAAEAEYAYRIEEDFVKAAERFTAAHEALPNDVDILTQKTLQLAKDAKLRKTMGKKGKERAEQMFDHKKQSEKLETYLCREVLLDRM